MFSYLLNYWSRVFHDLEELGEKLDLSGYKRVGDRWGLLGESFRFGKVIYLLLLLLLLLFYFILFHIFFEWVWLRKNFACFFFCVFVFVLWGEGVFGWILPEICILRYNRLCFERKSHLWKAAAKNSEATFLLMTSWRFSSFQKRK